VVTLNPGAGRYIFGVPWLLFGVYFLFRYLILGIAEHLKAGDIAGVFTGASGWLFIILFFGCIFIIPGWVLVFLRRKVVIDASRGEVDEKNDFLIFSRGEIHPLADFDQVLVVGTVALQRLYSSAKALCVSFAMRLLRTARRQTSPAPEHHFPLIF
jgi:hypothetical protein